MMIVVVIWNSSEVKIDEMVMSYIPKSPFYASQIAQNCYLLTKLMVEIPISRYRLRDDDRVVT